ncbi:hypothetical protein ACJMK2_015892 [Sinanodonta woodiana]|uniref:Uncharacterized protein n=1 Tax=Sinanodonta woodiana TaxID=1069815 RepID=A0ABD3UVC0_SINWO
MFDVVCSPKQNITAERNIFKTKIQQKMKTTDQHVTELILIAKNCKFVNIQNEMIRNRLVSGTNSEKVKERLLREDKLILQKYMLPAYDTKNPKSRFKVCRLNDLHQKLLV